MKNLLTLLLCFIASAAFSQTLNQSLFQPDQQTVITSYSVEIAPGYVATTTFIDAQAPIVNPVLLLPMPNYNVDWDKSVERNIEGVGEGYLGTSSDYSWHTSYYSGEVPAFSGDLQKDLQMLHNYAVEYVKRE